MAVPAWFDANSYFLNKLATMPGTDALALKVAFEAAGFPITDEGMYEHFTAYGNKEGVSPNEYFDNNSYLHAKAADYYKTGNVTAAQAQTMLNIMDQNGMSAWDHYLKFGAFEAHKQGSATVVGFNPSTEFDSQAYMNAKLALMKAEDPTYTMDQLVQVFAENGFTPLTHYYEFGIAEGLVATAVKSGAPGSSYKLTVNDDELFGTKGDDYISARLGTLNDGDYIDGGAGFDTLYAYVDNRNHATSPTVTNVEKILFRAQGVAGPEQGSNNISASSNWTVSIDAGDITSSAAMTYIGTDNSRADLAIEDVRINSNKTTVIVADTDSGDVDFGLFFDQQHLKPQDVQVSGKLNIQVNDVKDDKLFGQPLRENPFDGFNFEYIKANGDSETVKLHFRDADAALYKGQTATYDTLLTAFQHAIDDMVTANPALAGAFTVATGATYPTTATVGVETFTGTGTMIVISAVSGAVSANVDKYPTTGWTVSSGTVPAVGGIVWGVATEQTATCPLIQTNVWLDNVARVQWNDMNPACLPSDDIYGSEAGDVVIGGMAERGGVERFDITVDRGSWLKTLSSTNNALRMVTAINGDINGDGINGNVFSQANNAEAQKGQLYIGDSMEKGNGIVAWQDAPKLLSTTGLTDVKYFNGTDFTGQINIGAQLTAASYDKYMKDVDGLNTFHTNFAPDGNFQYNLGSNNDVLNMAVNANIAADQDFKLEIKALAGNDFVNFTLTDQTDSALYNIRQGILNPGHERVIIDGGSGNDTIKVWGNGSAIVYGGDGDDAIYVGQSPDVHSAHAGSQTPDGTGPGSANANQHNAVWVLNTKSASLLDKVVYWDDVNGAQPLDNQANGGPAVFQVSSTSGTAAGSMMATISFQGITTKIKIADIAANSGATTAITNITAETINQAIAKAVHDDPTLSKVIAVKDGNGHALLVESLINGAMDLTDLDIDFSLVDSTGANIAGLGWAAADANAYYGTGGGEFGNFGLEPLPVGVVNYNNGVYTIHDIYNDVNLATSTTARYSITVDGVQYFSTLATGAADDAGIIASLVSAKDAYDHKLTDKFIVADDATNNDGSITLTARDGNHTQVEMSLSVLNSASLNPNTLDGHTSGGVTSNYLVDAGAGNDVIVLNASAVTTFDVNTGVFDALSISGVFGNDVVFNYTPTTAPVGTSGSFTGGYADRIDVSSLLGLTRTNVEAGSHAVGGNNAAVVVTAFAHSGTNTFTTGYTVDEFVTQMNSASAGVWGDAGHDSVYFVDDAAGTTHKYSVFKVVENAGTDLTAGEVTLLGTITLADGAVLSNADLYV